MFALSAEFCLRVLWLSVNTPDFIIVICGLENGSCKIYEYEIISK